MARTIAKRKYVRRPGLVAAARELGRSVSHLRRVVITKERGSRALTERYRAWKSQQFPQPKSDRQTATPIAMNEQNPRFPTGTPDTPRTPPPPGPIDPAEANYLDEWVQNVVGELGSTVVVIQLQTCQETSECGDLGESLGTELHQAGLGHCDSTDWFPKTRHFFNVDTQHLAKALEFLKSSLAQRNLLAFVGIAYRDADVWRTFYPGTTT